MRSRVPDRAARAPRRSSSRRRSIGPESYLDPRAEGRGRYVPHPLRVVIDGGKPRPIGPGPIGGPGPRGPGGTMGHPRSVLAAVAAVAVVLSGAAVALAAPVSDTRVTVGSPRSPFSQNKQNEPAVAIDPSNPNVVVAGANEEIDMESCAAGAPNTCPFTPGVGVSGVYFSMNGGGSWTQPTYQGGWTARDCLGPAACTPHVGAIGTLPGYFQSGLVSDGDPAVSFGPKPDSHGTFSWSNGSRLYYANLAHNFGGTRQDQTFKGFEAIYVSRTDNVAAAASGDATAWASPVQISKQSSTTFSDKEQV